MRLPTLLAATFALRVSIHAALATPAPPLDVPAQIEQSDLIVVGQYTEATKSPAAGPHAWIRTDRILKGHLTDGAVMVDLGKPPFFFRKRPYGMFFLRKAGNTYARIDHGMFALVASPTAYLPRPNTTDPLTLAAWEFVNVYLMPESTAINPKTGLQDGISWGGLMYLDKNGNEAVDESVPTPPIRLAEDVYDRAADGLRSIPLASSTALSPTGPAARAWWPRSCLGVRLDDRRRRPLIRRAISRCPNEITANDRRHRWAPGVKP